MGHGRSGWVRLRSTSLIRLMLIILEKVPWWLKISKNVNLQSPYMLQLRYIGTHLHVYF